MSVRPGSCLDDARVASSKSIWHVALHIVGVNEHRVIASAFEVRHFLPKKQQTTRAAQNDQVEKLREQEHVRTNNHDSDCLLTPKG